MNACADRGPREVVAGVLADGHPASPLVPARPRPALALGAPRQAGTSPARSGREASRWSEVGLRRLFPLTNALPGCIKPGMQGQRTGRPAPSCPRLGREEQEPAKALARMALTPGIVSEQISDTGGADELSPTQTIAGHTSGAVPIIPVAAPVGGNPHC